jgi:hypothetical protein
MNSRGVVIIDFLFIPSSFVLVHIIRTEEEGQVLMVPTSWWSSGVSILKVIRPWTTGIRQRSTNYRVSSCRHLHVVSPVDFYAPDYNVTEVNVFEYVYCRLSLNSQASYVQWPLNWLLTWLQNKSVTDNLFRFIIYRLSCTVRDKRGIVLMSSILMLF